MRVLVLVGLLACGPGLRSDTRLAGREALAGAASDPTKLESLLRGSVVSGGIWFEDPACAKEFAAGDIPAAKLGAFARCLAALHMQASTREDALGDVVVMTYVPGFELEARVVSELGGPRLTWIGFSARQASDTLPSITGEALEARRLAGDRDGPLDDSGRATADAALLTLPFRAADNPVGKPFTSTWMKVCLDATGAVTSVRPFETMSANVETAFVAATKSWKFRPFVVRDRAIAACAMARMSYPPGAAPQPEVLPMPPPPSRNKRPPVMLAGSIGVKALEGHRTAGTIQVVPDDDTRTAIRRAGEPKVVGTFRICVDDTGMPEHVLPLKSTGFAGYDNRILATMRQWRYSPYKIDDVAVPVCITVTYVYTQRS